MKNFTIKEFYKNRYLPLEENLLLSFNEYCIENQQKLETEYIEWFYQFVHTLYVSLERPVARIHCTMPYTDFLCGNANINISAFDRQGQVMNSASLNCLWMMELWKNFEEELCDEREYIRSLVHPVMFRRFYPATVRKIMAVLGEYMKVWLALDLDKIMEGILRNEEFYVTYGEYIGKQEIIGRLRPKVDLLKYIDKENLLEDDLKYRSFAKKRYRMKKIDEIDIENSKFGQCLFEPWTFGKTNLRNVIFDDCHFHLTKFEKTNLTGAIFVNCIFDTCRFHSVKADDENSRYPLLFMDCCFADSKFLNCDWMDVEFVDCEFACIKLTDCVMNDKALQEIGKADANNDRNICKY